MLFLDFRYRIFKNENRQRPTLQIFPSPQQRTLQQIRRPEDGLREEPTPKQRDQEEIHGTWICDVGMARSIRPGCYNDS